MLILKNDNTIFDLNQIGKELKENVHFGVFDFSDKLNFDYFFRPLIMTETFTNVTIYYQIGPYKVMLPQEWSIILSDPETAEIELIPIDEINSRDFHVLSFNPVRGGLHKFLPITAIDIFPDVSWVVPRLSYYNFLVMPLENKPNPDCIFLINEKDQRKIGALDLSMFI